MRLTRRNFLTAIPFALGFLKFGGSLFGQSGKAGGLFPLPPGLGGDRLAQLDWNAFLPYQYSDFTFSKGEGTWSMRLADMNDSAPDGFAGKSEHPCFELHFEGRFVKPLESDTYRVEHFALGTFDLFITPGGRKGKNSSAVAVINRLIR